MTKIIKVGNIAIQTFSKNDIDRVFYNAYYGKNGRVISNNILEKSDVLSKYINNDTMGALDNYAGHEHIKVYFTPLESDLFDNVSVSVFKKGREIVEFPMDTADEKKSVADFLRELYRKVYEAVHPEQSKQVKNIAAKQKGFNHSSVETFIYNLLVNLNAKRFELMTKYIAKHGKDRGLGKIFADVLEEIQYGEFNKINMN